VGPIITNVPGNHIVDCAVNAIPLEHLFQFDTDCGLGSTVDVSGPITNGTAGCPGTTISYTYTVTDVCGRSASATQVYTLANEGPEFICPTQFCVIDCSDDLDVFQAKFDAYADLAIVTSSCSENSEFTITNNFNSGGFIPNNCGTGPVAFPGTIAYQVVTFTATDACDRQSTCTSLVVLVDTDSPVINGNVSIGLANCNDADLQQGYTDWATNQLNGLSVTDGCASGIVDLSYSPLVPNVDCSNGLASTLVSFTATDGCGNATILNAYYRIIDNGTTGPVMATISGSILTEENEALEVVEVTITGSTMSGTLMTDDEGYFGFNTEMNQNYEVSPQRDDDYLNGITTMDLILIGRHVLELQTIDSPYKLIAADINRSGTITAMDMIGLRRLILAIDNQFANNTSWRFVDANYIFPNPTNPFASTFPEVQNINNLSESAITDFIGVKIGDVNGSAIPNQLVNTGDTRDRETLNFAIEDQQLIAGETYTVDFMARDFKEIMGYQFTLNYDETILAFSDIVGGQLPNLKADNFGIHNELGAVTCSWNDQTTVSVNDDEVLFSLAFTARENILLSEALTLDSRLTVAEAYGERSEQMNLGLTFNNLEVDELVLFQNQPNPFKAETMIGFTLPETSTATLTVYDLSGRVLKQIKGDFVKGYNSVSISRSDLSASGLLFYKLETAGGTATMKMIVE